jgi:hypothetical protein
MDEYLPIYKKELKSTDKERIKDIIFKKVYSEMVTIEQRKNARKWSESQKPEV